MMRIATRAAQVVQQIRANSQLANSVYLMLATFIVAGLGFVFWTTITHDYTSTAVGLATALLSVSNLLAMLGLAGFDTTFVRYLPKAHQPQEYISSGMAMVAMASMFLSIAALFILPTVTPKLAFVTEPIYGVLFVASTVATALNTLTNAIFLAHKNARDIFIINTLFSICKVVLPIAIGGDSAITIFIFAGVAQAVGLALSVYGIQRKYGYRISLRVHTYVLKIVRRYSLSMYVSSVFNLLPPTVLPLMIVALLGATYAAYYYMAFTIATVLYTIAYASMQAAFSEGSHNEAALRTYITKAIRLVGRLLIPAVVILILASSNLLQIFGKEYAHHAANLLRLFAGAAFFVAIYSALGTVFKVTHNLRGVVSMNIVYAATIIGGVAILVPRLGLLGVGWAWLLGNATASICGLFFLEQMKISKIREAVYGKIASARE